MMTRKRRSIDEKINDKITILPILTSKSSSSSSSSHRQTSSTLPPLNSPQSMQQQISFQPIYQPSLLDYSAVKCSLLSRFSSLNSANLKAGFQPYRLPVPTASISSSAGSSTVTNSSLDDQFRLNSSPSVSTSSGVVNGTSVNSNLTANHLLPYNDPASINAVAAAAAAAAVGGFSPYPFLHPPPPSSHPALAAHHLTSNSFRLDDPLYLERYNLLRSAHTTSSQIPTDNHAVTVVTSSSQSANSTSVPSYRLSSRYSELLATHQERVLNEERQRLLNHMSSVSSSSTSSSPSSSSVSDLKVNNQNSPAENEKRNRCDYTANPLIQTTSRDFQSCSLHLKNGSLNAAYAVDKALNLTSNVPIASLDLTLPSNKVSGVLWRPQGNDDDTDTVEVNGNQMEIGLVSLDSNELKRRSIQVPYGYASVKKPRLDETRALNNLTSKPPVKTSITVCPVSLSAVNRSAPLVSTFSPDIKTQIEELGIAESKEEKEPVIVSKLDMQELKLKSRRIENAKKVKENGIDDGLSECELISMNNDEIEYSDIEAEEAGDEDDEENRVASLRQRVIIKKGPPLKLDTNPKKLDFLSRFGLCTHREKQKIEFKNYIERRRPLREVMESRFSFVDEPAKPSFQPVPCALKPSKILPSSLNQTRHEPHLEEKLGFMSILGLKMQSNSEQQRNKEIIWNEVLEEKRRRLEVDLCYPKFLNNLESETLKIWLNQVRSHQSSKNGEHSSQNSSKRRTNHTGINGLNTKSPVKIDAREFAQRFHKSVFDNVKNSETNPTRVDNCRINESKSFTIQGKKEPTVTLFPTTYKSPSLMSPVLSSQPSTASTNSITLNHNNHQNNGLTINETNVDMGDDRIDRNNHTSTPGAAVFKWPGIEQIMESYEKYHQETQREKEFLSERLVKFQMKIQDLNSEAEELYQKMRNLVQHNRQLEDERAQHERLLENLRRSLTQFQTTYH